jgi:hypothetical protein
VKNTGVFVRAIMHAFRRSIVRPDDTVVAQRVAVPLCAALEQRKKDINITLKAVAHAILRVPRHESLLTAPEDACLMVALFAGMCKATGVCVRVRVCVCVCVCV